MLAEKDAAYQHLQERFEQLQKNYAELQDRYIKTLNEQNEALHQLNQVMQELLQLKKMIFGSKRERFIAQMNAQQLSLFGSEATDLTLENVVDKQHIEFDRKAPRKHEGRNPLPDHLPVNEIIIEPIEDTSDMVKIGEEITETLEYTPASLVKKRVIRPKYARKNQEGIVIAELPSRPIPKGIAESSLLSHIIVSKFIDHMPFYRQIQRFKRDFDWDVTDSTINEWFIASCTLLHPLYEKLKENVLSSGYIQADESPIKVLDKDKPGSTHQGYQWVYHSPESGLVLFNYRKGRGQNGPKEMLSEYHGVLQTDGWSAYDRFEDQPGIILVGCIAHARRYFSQALENNKAKSEEALSIFQELYSHERMCRELKREERKAYRDVHSLPLFEKLRAWVENQTRVDIEKKSTFGKAITYLQKQWPKLERIWHDGRVEIDNNLIENKIRPLALGRKNYLFAGSHDAAQRIAMMYSFFGSCKAHDINPYEWLKNTLDRIQDTKLPDLHTLLPGSYM